MDRSDMLIDQTSEKEKAAQIPLMRYIYQQASRVIIWLDVKGEEAAASMVVRASRWAGQKSRQSAISSDASNLSLGEGEVVVSTPKDMPPLITEIVQYTGEKSFVPFGYMELGFPVWRRKHKIIF